MRARRDAANKYVGAMRGMARTVLEMVAEGLGVAPRGALADMVVGDGAASDQILRLNHYPPCPPLLQNLMPNCSPTGFGEHTDPQLISILHSNSTSGLQVALHHDVGGRGCAVVAAAVAGGCLPLPPRRPAPLRDGVRRPPPAPPRHHAHLRPRERDG
jgi:isopenicillin N synthase-like dioxygenase